MPDSFNNYRASEGGPGDWSEAFAALPLEAPPGDRWLRIARAMEAPARLSQRAHRERRTTWAIGVASAAVLVVAAWSPLSHWLQVTRNTRVPSAATVTTTPGSRAAIATRKAPVNAAARSDATTIVGTAAKSAQASDADRSSGAVAAMARSGRTHPARKSAQPPTRIAKPSTQTAPQQVSTAETDSIAATPSATGDLQSLQAQSARLEALVAIARDERVGNASSELLSAELDAGIAAVDASLSQDDLDDSRRQQLWQQRVDLLQQLAGVETTARWLAAQGMSNETALVSVD